MSITINHDTNDLSATGSGSITIDGATPGGGGGPDLFAESYDGTSTKPVVTGTNSVAIGMAHASGADSFSAALQDSTTTYGSQGTNSITMQRQARSTSYYGLALGLYAVNTATYGGLAIGFNTVSGNYSNAIGSDCLSTETYSTSLGRSAKSDIIGKMAYTGGRVNNTKGSSQQGTYVLMKQTTDATQTALTTNGSGTGTARNRMFIGANTAYAFTGMVVGRETGSTGDLAAAWQVQGLVKTASNESPTLVTKTINVVDNTPSWGFDITTFNVDTGVVGIDFLVTGQASKNISWVVTITTTEVINP
tara:strand:- start:946 stop:1863 length:918 start_codon:yes stop_codon:yes gene_type:complete